MFRRKTTGDVDLLLLIAALIVLAAAVLAYLAGVGT